MPNSPRYSGPARPTRKAPELAAPYGTKETKLQLNRYTVDLSSRVADYDVTISGIPATMGLEAEKAALSFMAVPDMWLCTGVDLTR